MVATEAAAMRVAIVCYEDPERWILGKFARKLVEHLDALGIEAHLLRAPDAQFDVNHHIIYVDYDRTRATSLDTLLVTHVDTAGKLARLARDLDDAKLAICMSRQTAAQLAQAGIPAERLEYVSPAHDDVMVPRKLRVGIFNKVHEDGRTRDRFLPRIADQTNLRDFAFTIMGSGWQPTVDALRQRGIDVTYLPAFDRDEYVRIMPTLDYFLYLGMDEGSMAFVDALAAGVNTIATAQGFHLDVAAGLTHAFTDRDELAAIFESIATERNRAVDAIRGWSWRRYAEQHVEIWQQLLAHGAVTTPIRRPALAANAVAIQGAGAFAKTLRAGSLRSLLHTAYDQRRLLLSPGAVLQKAARFAKRLSRSR